MRRANAYCPRRVLNDESALLELIGDVLAPSEGALWAVDINHGGAALLIGLLLGHDQPMVYLTGLAVHQASAAYRGQGKTDAKDAFVIADQARMRKDLGALRPGDEIAVDLKILVRRRTDLVNDRTRQINRLREQLLENCPALERALSLTNKGPILLLTGYQTPAAIRRSGAKRIETWLKNRKVKGAALLAQAAVEAAQAQHTALPGEKLAASMGARLAKGVMALEEEIAELDVLIEARFHEHPHAEVIQSLPGMGAMLGATFIAATGGDMEVFGTADRLAAFAGLAPVLRDSGLVSGNMRRPRRYHRGLLRAFYLSSMASLRSCPASRAYYERQARRGEGAQAGRAVTRTSQSQRSVGDDPRRSVLSNCTTSHGGCLTFSLGSRLWSGVERGSNLIRVFAVRRTCKRPPSDPVLRHRWISAKAVVVSLVHRGVLRDAFAEVSHFRYACLTAGGDALFELCDALLCTDGPVRTLADLASRRNTAVGTGLCTAGSTRADRRRPATSGPGQGVPLPRAADGRLVLAVDVSPWLRPDSNTCADRAFCHTFGRGEGKHQMVPGWPYSVVAALESGRTSWTAVLDAVRLEPGADVAAVTTVQIGEVIERLVAAGQWRPGDPEVLGPNSLARSPALITADVTLGP